MQKVSSSRPLPPDPIHEAESSLHCRQMAIKKRDAATVAKFKEKLAEKAAAINGVFMHYELDTGVWIMKVNHFGAQ